MARSIDPAPFPYIHEKPFGPGARRRWRPWFVIGCLIKNGPLCSPLGRWDSRSRVATVDRVPLVQ